MLVLLVGRATRLAELLQAEDKTYVAELCLGLSTDTQDGFGRTTGSDRGFSLHEERLYEVFNRFRGSLQQVPPMTSAVRQGGRRLYELAHAGLEVERPPRQVFVDELDVLRIDAGVTSSAAGPFGFGTRVTFRVVCSKGTYVRTLCHDIGAALGCGAYMSFLLRTRVGAIDLHMTRSLDELEREAEAGLIRLERVDSALAHIPSATVSDEAAKRVMHGQTVGPKDIGEQARPSSLADGESASTRPRPGADLLRLYDGRGTLLALARRDGDDPGSWRPRIVFQNE